LEKVSKRPIGEVFYDRLATITNNGSHQKASYANNVAGFFAGKEIKQYIGEEKAPEGHLLDT